MLLLSAAALSAQVELKTAAQAKLSAADVAVKIADRIFTATSAAESFA